MGFALVLFIYLNNLICSNYHITICSINNGDSNNLLTFLEQKYSNDLVGKKYKLLFTNWLNPQKPCSIKVDNDNLENLRKKIFNDVNNNNNYQINTTRYQNTYGYPPQHINIKGNLNALRVFDSNCYLGSDSGELEFRIGIIGNGSALPTYILHSKQPQHLLNNNDDNYNYNNNTKKKYKILLEIYYNLIIRPGLIQVIEFVTAINNIDKIQSIITDCNNKFFNNKNYILTTTDGKTFREQKNKNLIKIKSYDNINNIGINKTVKPYVYNEMLNINNIENIVIDNKNLELVVDNEEMRDFDYFFGFTNETNSNISYKLILTEQ